MKFLKFFLCSLIFGLLQLTASVDSNFPENLKITQYLPLDSTSFFEVNGIKKQTEPALNLVSNLLALKTQYSNLRAAIIIAINNGLVEKLTADNITFSNIKRIDTKVKLDSKMHETLEKFVSEIFSFKPKNDSIDSFIELINGMIVKNKNNKNKIFEALNNYLNIYESIVYDVCLSMKDGKFDAQSILNMQNSAENYVLRFVLASNAQAVGQQVDFVKKYFKYLSEQVQEQQSVQAAKILDAYPQNLVTLYFNTDFGQDEYATNLTIKTPSTLIKELGKNSLRAQIIKAINNIIYENKNKFSDSIKNGLPKGKGKKKSKSQAFIGQVEEAVDENALLNKILNADALNIGFLVAMLSGKTKDTLMLQVWDANKALSGLERIIYIICKKLEESVAFSGILEYLEQNAQIIMGPIIEKFGSGDDLEEDKSKSGPFGKLFDFYIEYVGDKLSSLKSDETNIIALEEQESQEAKLAAELAAQEAAKAQAKLKPKPRLPRIDVLINCSTALSVLR